MKLSRQAIAIADTCDLPIVLCKLIGQLASFDVTAKVGDPYYVVAKRIGCSYLRLENAVILPICQNDYIHLYKITGVTACSYMLRFISTIVLTKVGDSFLHYNLFKPMMLPLRRVYPLSQKSAPQDLLKTFIQIHDQIIPGDNVERFGNSYSFFIDFTPELENQLGIYIPMYLGYDLP
jgi:hypothetical protein